MSLENAREYLKQFNADGRILLFEQSSATVELAAAAVGTDPARIAKTLSFMGPKGPMLIVTAGDTKIDNGKYKKLFGMKAKMLDFVQVEELVGHAIGGVCPFGIKDGVTVFLDVSLKRFGTVFPACGSGNSAIEVTCGELSEFSKSAGWIDVSKQA
ncbi:MAG: YbaK/EbsC family protein [Mailhella sp.]|nr:YbaK/EbsC family protein [Mailhella sp.]